MSETVRWHLCFKFIILFEFQLKGWFLISFVLFVFSSLIWRGRIWIAFAGAAVWFGLVSRVVDSSRGRIAVPIQLLSPDWKSLSFSFWFLFVGLFGSPCFCWIFLWCSMWVILCESRIFSCVIFFGRLSEFGEKSNALFYSRFVFNRRSWISVAQRDEFPVALFFLASLIVAESDFASCFELFNPAAGSRPCSSLFATSAHRVLQWHEPAPVTPCGPWDRFRLFSVSAADSSHGRGQGFVGRSAAAKKPATASQRDARVCFHSSRSELCSSRSARRWLKFCPKLVVLPADLKTRLSALIFTWAESVFASKQFPWTFFLSLTAHVRWEVGFGYGSSVLPECVWIFQELVRELACSCWFARTSLCFRFDFRFSVRFDSFLITMCSWSS
jgi:hypothetical protein